MALDQTEIFKALKDRNKRQLIDKAVSYQNRIKFHAEINTAVTAQTYSDGPLRDFLGFAKSLLPEDIYKTFMTLFRYPVKTNEIAEVCFDKLFKVFDGRNPAFNYQFLTTEARDDWEYYRQDVIGEPEVWKTKGWDNFKYEINSVLIVDLPAEQDVNDRLPRPYFYWLPIGEVIAYEEKDGAIEWIAFKQPSKKIAFFDDQYYRIIDDNNGIYTIESEQPHDIGYCPARFFWNKPINLKEPLLKEHPLSKCLSSLDWFLFHHISKQHLDLYGSYPIYSGYTSNCDYTTSSGEYCNRGFVCDSHNNYLRSDEASLVKCPRCEAKNKIGLGSFVEIPIPSDTQPDLKDPVKMLPADVPTLQYNVDETVRLRESIINTVVGIDGELINDQAVNEKQVGAAFENQSAILNRIKLGFEGAIKWVDDTICKLRYGNLFVSSSISLGTEFYQVDADTLRERFKVAKAAGASESELDNLSTQIIEVENRNNPLQLQRMLILRELEPYPAMTRDEAIKLHGLGVMENWELLLKLNFVSFVRRFERENINIIEFGVNLPFEEKIEIINKKLKDYANEREFGRGLEPAKKELQGAGGGSSPVSRNSGGQTV